MKKKFLVTVGALLTILSLLCACGASKSESAQGSAPNAYYSAGDMAESPMESPEFGGVSADAGAGAGANEGAQAAAYGQKIIYTTQMSVETKEFQKSFDAILEAVAQANGYVASKNVSGGYTSTSGYYNSRYASLTLKIPAEQYNAFLAKGDSFGNVTHQSDSSEDITASYIDTESRLRSLEAQRDQLMELLDQAQTVEDIITIQDKLSEVIYRIESYTSTLKTYDDLVSYCTVYIDLEEVTTITVHTATFGEELVEAVKGSGRSIVNFLRSLVIFIIYAIPYIAIFFLMFLLVRKILRAAKARKAARGETAPLNNKKTVDENSPFVNEQKKK